MGTFLRMILDREENKGVELLVDGTPAEGGEVNSPDRVGIFDLKLKAESPVAQDSEGDPATDFARKKGGTKNVKEDIHCQIAKKPQEGWLDLCRLASLR